MSSGGWKDYRIGYIQHVRGDDGWREWDTIRARNPVEARRLFSRRHYSYTIHTVRLNEA